MGDGGGLPWSTEVSEVLDVGADGPGHGGVVEIANVAFGADLFHDLADRRVVDVGDAREEVVLDLEVEAAD